MTNQVELMQQGMRKVAVQTQRGIAVVDLPPDEMVTVSPRKYFVTATNKDGEVEIGEDPIVALTWGDQQYTVDQWGNMTLPSRAISFHEGFLYHPPRGKSYRIGFAPPNPVPKEETAPAKPATRKR